MLPAVRSAVVSSARRRANYYAILLNINIKNARNANAAATTTTGNTVSSWNQVRWEATNDSSNKPSSADQLNNNNIEHQQTDEDHLDVPKSIDRSKVPTLNEDDLEEIFISGGGPGGQKVNKAVNCCQLRHKPTNIIVKVHQSRSLKENRKIARELLVEKLDNLYNGESSVVNQKKRVALYKMSVKDSQAQRRRAMKEQFKRTLAMSEEHSTNG